jgi:hypothetical protein
VLAAVLSAPILLAPARQWSWLIRDQVARDARARGYYQLPLQFITEAPARGPLRALDMMRCTRFAASLLVRHCLERQVALVPRRQETPVYPTCYGGRCGQGCDVSRRCAYDPTDGFAARSAKAVRAYSTWRPDFNEQRRAAKRWRKEHMVEVDGRLSPMSEAALLTPDDGLPR